MKDYCIQIFGKSIREITIEDLLYFFNDPKEESEILEFKSGNGEFEKAFNNNILRTVSAFLNSSGGLLIWGAPEDKAPEKGMPKVCAGDLVPVKEKKEKDQLINRISTSISYMPNGIRIDRLEYQEGYIYIIEVQESESKPHQLNGQYLIRLDGQSKPAPHYLVESMFNRFTYPIIEGYIDFHNLIKTDSGYNLSFDILVINTTPSQTVKNLQIYLKSAYGVISRYSNFHETNIRSRYGNLVELPIVSSLHFGMPTRDTYLLKMSHDKIVNLQNINTITLIFGSDNSPAKNSFYRFKIDGNEKFDFKKSVEHYFENKSFKELQEENGTNNEKFLNLALKR